MSTQQDDNLYCPACGKWFKTPQATQSHLNQATSCKWYRKGKNREGHRRTMRTPTPEPELLDDISDELDIPVEDVMQEWDDNVFRFILADPNQPGPSTHTAPQTLHRANHLSDSDNSRFVETHPSAGYVIRMNDNLHTKWKRSFGLAMPVDPEGDVDMENIDRSNGFAPFASELDWRIAEWVVKEGPGHKAFDRLLDIPGVREKLGLSYSNIRGLHQIIDEIPDRAVWKSKLLSFPDRPDEKYTIRYRDPLDAIRSLLGNPAHAKNIVYAPKRIFSSRMKDNRVYNEMWTGKWWSAVQAELPQGGALAPVIIATDKTQLTQFSGSKSAYPVYLTLGNLPKALRRKPTENACILLGYLSCDKIVRKGLSKQTVKSRNQKLFHRSMRLILEPLIAAGKSGIEVTGGDGCVRRVFPILASYVADYPEQCLVGCAKYGTCPKCQRSAAVLQDPEPGTPRSTEWTLGVIAAAEQQKTENQFHDYCMEQEVAAIHKPFWQGFPLTNLATSLTPDVLHQLYQGVFKHLVGWCQSLMTPEELDARIRCLPPAFGIRHFPKGVSVLSQISGSERKAMARILLGCLIGRIPSKGIAACRAILDFIYLAQYSTHDEGTLACMVEALKLWHKNRDYFITARVRKDFNIPKFHSLLHYVDSIRMFGTTDNYNTEMFERLHIDFAKKGWRASNRRDEFPQMIQWLGRQEKVASFSTYQAWLEASKKPLLPPVIRTFTGQAVQFALTPQAPRQRLSELAEAHAAPSFIYSLKETLNTFGISRLTPAQLNASHLPFTRLDVYHNFKFEPTSLDPGDLDSAEGAQTVISRPANGTTPARFDTVIVREKGTAEATGLTELAESKLSSGFHPLY
ncbi:hypothetical protein C8F04DRAFT_1295696 [Mycena alexandri]|uniref:Zinc finger double-stranded RNA binding domain-containing protein n=1 Tax=Mycena alexandri TaxID=1745969 RepID=A0AAD6SGE5_9AGAR|nr:hypothetical protein C8F04DRAFT_1274414 [Mycena alexandri]KAJ7027060.1 hypothetical protein C8F04DRAFT_1295696 [Mycena alexandri]